MKQEVSEKDIKEIAFDGLKYFRDFCNEKGIKYFLAYGTLIGAVRHHGFIPWDDDIDVWVLREDYDRLLSLTSEINNERWRLLSIEKEKHYCFPWAKLCHKDTVIYPPRFENGFLYGVSIDIFPVDNCPDDITNQEQATEYSKELYSELSKVINYYSPYTGGLQGIGNIVSIVKKRTKYTIRKGESICFEDKIKQLIQKCTTTRHSNYVHSVLSLDNVAYPREAFDELTICSFENESFAIPKGYDTLLRICYGDYMQLPPIEKRISNHTYKAFYN